MTQVINAALRIAILVLALTSCTPERSSPDAGNAERGRDLLHRYGCNACHKIPRVTDAVGTVGPPLDDMGSRVYLAGALPNSPENLARWIQAPQRYKPGTAMPNLDVTASDARDMAAYLERLR